MECLIYHTGNIMVTNVMSYLCNSEHHIDQSNTTISYLAEKGRNTTISQSQLAPLSTFTDDIATYAYTAAGKCQSQNIYLL